MECNLVRAEWQAIVRFVIGESRSRALFLSRQDERDLKDQAGDDWRAGDAMVDSMNRIACLARDRALATLEAWCPPVGGRSEALAAAIALLESLPDARDHYSSLGVHWVVLQLRAQQIVTMLHRRAEP